MALVEKEGIVVGVWGIDGSGYECFRRRIKRSSPILYRHLPSLIYSQLTGHTISLVLDIRNGVLVKLTFSRKISIEFEIPGLSLHAHMILHLLV